MYKSPIPIAIVLVLLAVVLAAWRFGTIKSTGIPLGTAMRLPDAVAQIIRTTERYLPSLHRNPDKDRFRLDLLLVSLADPAQQEMISLSRSQDRGALQPMTKILGADGDLVWVQAPELLAVNRKTRRVTKFPELLKLNPELHVFLSSARFEFTNQLVAVSPDWQQAYAFAAESLRASPCAPPPRGSWIGSNSSDPVNGALCSGGFLTPTNWFGALSAAEAASNFKPGFSLPKEFPAGLKNEPRLLYQGRVEPVGARARIAGMERISETAYRNAAMLKDASGAGLLRLSNPDSVLLLHRASAELTAPWALERITTEGKSVWSTDTGIGTLKQILSDPQLIVLIGERPPVPNKVSEPILVLLNTDTAAVRTVSLWR